MGAGGGAGVRSCGALVGICAIRAGAALSRLRVLAAEIVASLGAAATTPLAAGTPEVDTRPTPTGAALADVPEGALLTTGAAAAGVTDARRNTTDPGAAAADADTLADPGASLRTRLPAPDECGLVDRSPRTGALAV